ncbi:hypothetical protein ACEPAI_6860 [Sanghuangporus weigelae]
MLSGVARIFLSKHKIKIVISSASSNSALAIGAITWSLHFGANALGARSFSFFSMAVAVFASLYEVYIEAVTAVFVCFSITISIAVAIFLIACCNLDAEMQSIMNSKLFTVTSLVLKHLLDNNIIPVNYDNSSVAVHGIKSALFLASFIFSIMSLWLQACGVHLSNPIRSSSYSLAFSNRASMAASILYWSGAAFLVALLVMTVMSWVTIPMAVKVACGVLVFCASAELYQQCKKSGRE